MTGLFKYVSSIAAVLNISAGSLKFTQVDDLNDPSELSVGMNTREVRESLISLRQTGLSDEQFKWLGYQDKLLRLLAPEEIAIRVPASVQEVNRMLLMSIYDNLDYMEMKLLATIDLIRSRVGILSLSERYDSLPMWAHYGNLGLGYVIEFDELDKTFSGDDTGSLNVLKPVRYSNDAFGMTFDPTSQDDIFFSKFSDWSYEREWRVVTSLSGCRRDEANHLYLRDVDRHHIRRVICGWRIPSSEIASISSTIQSINKDIIISRARIEKGRVLVGDLT